MNELLSIGDQIVHATIDILLADGFLISVNDGEETTVVQSGSPDEIFAALKTTDWDYLYAYKKGDDRRYGWVWLIHENGIDVVSDYTVNLEPQMDRVMKLIDKYYEEGGQ
jgi:hypothetical protein